jgi:hydroxymethylbilane synthase
VQVDLVTAAIAGLAGSGRHVPETVSMETIGDRRRDVPIHAIGGRGVFAKEVDEAVLHGAADASVHSAKDLPSNLADGLVIGAFLPRADPRDAIVGLPLLELPPGGLVATGSVRRRAQLAWLRPDLRFAELRGNMGSRLGKVPQGGAIVVAMAALDRLGWADRAAQVLSTTEMLPQVGQGAVAVCCRRGDAQALEQLQAVDDLATRAAVEAERAWLHAVGGGCDAPVAAHARVGAGGEVRLEAMIATLDGHAMVRQAIIGTDPAELGETLAVHMLDECGGRALLDQTGVAS